MLRRDAYGFRDSFHSKAYVLRDTVHLADGVEYLNSGYFGGAPLRHAEAYSSSGWIRR